MKGKSSGIDPFFATGAIIALFGFTMVIEAFFGRGPSKYGGGPLAPLQDPWPQAQTGLIIITLGLVPTTIGLWRMIRAWRR